MLHHKKKSLPIPKEDPFCNPMIFQYQRNSTFANNSVASFHLLVAQYTTPHVSPFQTLVWFYTKCMSCSCCSRTTVANASRYAEDLKFLTSTNISCFLRFMGIVSLHCSSLSRASHVNSQKATATAFLLKYAYHKTFYPLYLLSLFNNRNTERKRKVWACSNIELITFLAQTLS